MKKIFKNSIVLVLLFTTLSSNATEISSLKNVEDGKTILFLTDVEEGEQLIIKDDLGLIVYKESISKDGNYSKAFDLTELPDGKYNFELDKHLRIQIIPFKVESNAVTFNKKAETVIHKPLVKESEQSLYITKLALEKEPLKIALYYNNTLIHAETIENTQKIQRIYKLSEGKIGVYKLVFETNGRTFVKKVTL
ncbi:hypothetical protein [Lacinutrix sp. Hel_I_90]|uniref:hypothetical protein n=1 Tax=Lacinutrix sp. Hel_I_90 TaxID=1249999 RepID=UPI0005CB7627|nr:hypothetical protein [Lacinutrix sp. Hel_I_90]